jgi:protease-4
MSTFTKTFSKMLGFLFAILFFTILLIIVNLVIGNNEKSNFSYFSGDVNSEEKIAILNLSGPIISDPKETLNYNVFKTLDSIYPSIIEEYLNDLKKENIIGLIISMDSPGGSVSASKTIYNLLSEFRNTNKIPIYFHTKNILASGGYWLSLSGDKIFASYGALIGSIGVKGPDWLYYNSPTSISSGVFSQSVESPSGIQLFSNSAGLSKDIYNPFRKPTKKETTQLNEMIGDIYTDFINLVSSSRKIEISTIRNEIGAMIYNHKQAKELFLIDDFKNLKEVIELLSKELNLDNKKIISNKKNNKLQILNLNFLNNFHNSNLTKNYKLEIKKKFCNNLMNEISVVSITLKSSNC